MSATTTTADRAILCISPKPPDPDAIRFAEQIVDAFRMQLVLLHSHRDTAELTEGHKSAETIQTILTKRPDELKEVRGTLEDVLQDELDPAAHELVILGTSMESYDRRSVLASRRLANRIGDSVLVIQQPPKTLKRILVCTGGHAASNLVIMRGLQLGAALNAEVTVLHVVTGIPSMYTGLQGIEEGLQDILSRDTPLANHLREAAATAEEMGVEAKLELRHGVVVEEILRAIEVGHYDLVVIGSPEPRRIFERLALGHIGPQLLTSAKIPLLIARIEPKDS
jgi:nucleotide-binding universal stress UspA family protein